MTKSLLPLIAALLCVAGCSGAAEREVDYSVGDNTAYKAELYFSLGCTSCLSMLERNADNLAKLNKSAEITLVEIPGAVPQGLSERLTATGVQRSQLASRYTRCAASLGNAENYMEAVTGFIDVVKNALVRESEWKRWVFTGEKGFDGRLKGKDVAFDNGVGFFRIYADRFRFKMEDCDSQAADLNLRYATSLSRQVPAYPSARFVVWDEAQPLNTLENDFSSTADVWFRLKQIGRGREEIVYTGADEMLLQLKAWYGEEGGKADFVVEDPKAQKPGDVFLRHKSGEALILVRRWSDKRLMASLVANTKKSKAGEAALKEFVKNTYKKSAPSRITVSENKNNADLYNVGLNKQLKVEDIVQKKALEKGLNDLIKVQKRLEGKFG